MLQPVLENNRMEEAAEKVLAAVVFLTGWIALGSELLSGMHLLSFGPVSLFWILTLAAGIGIAFRTGFFFPGKGWSPEPSVRPDREGRALLVILLFLTITAGLSAILYPPHTWDGLLYHMPRQVRWIQNRSLEYFPTHFLYQLYQEPLGDLLSMHTLILFGTDRLSNLVSWTAYLSILPAVFFLASQLGASRSAGAVAAILALSVPVAYLEASTTKNDVLFALWYMVLLGQSVRIFRRRSCSYFRAAWIGVAFGLFLLTKILAYLYGLPLVLAISYGLIRCHGKNFWKSGLLIACLALSLNAGNLVRNMSFFGSPIPAPADDQGKLVERYTLGGFLSRCLRDFAYQLGSPIGGLNQRIEQGVSALHQRMGLRVDDPATTIRPFAVLYHPNNEYQASAPAHLWMTVGLFFLLPLFRKRVDDPMVWYLWGISFLSYFLYALVCKFDYAQGPRFLLPVLFTQSALGAVLSEKIRLGRARLSHLWVILALAALLPAFVFHPRSLVWPKYLRQSETDSLFLWAPQLQTELTEAARYARELGAATVAIDAHVQELHKEHPTPDPFEYLIMRLLTAPSRFLQPRIEPFNVDNSSAALWRDRYRPPDCVIFYFHPAQETLIDRQTGQAYRAARKWDHIALYVPQGSGSK